MTGLSLETRLPNLKSIALTPLELHMNLMYEKFPGSHDPDQVPFQKVLWIISGLTLETLLSNLKSVA